MASYLEKCCFENWPIWRCW